MSQEVLKQNEMHLKWKVNRLCKVSALFNLGAPMKCHCFQESHMKMQIKTLHWYFVLNLLNHKVKKDTSTSFMDLI